LKIFSNHFYIEKIKAVIKQALRLIWRSAFLLGGNMSVLSIYGGEVTAGDSDGDLITNERKLALKGTRGNPVILSYALRTIGASKPALVVKGTLDGPQKEWFSVSLNGESWSDRFDIPYIAGGNVLFFLKCDIPEDADYGDNTSNYLNLDYFGGV